MKYGELIDINSLLTVVRSQEKEIQYCIYGKGSSDDATLETLCVIGEYPEITDDDEEVFPDYILAESLEFWFRDELLEDVVINAVERDPLISNDKILEAVKYYNQNDDFMDIC